LKEYRDGTTDRFFPSWLQIKLFEITAKAVIYQTFSQIPQKLGNSKGFLQAEHASHLCMNCKRVSFRAVVAIVESEQASVLQKSVEGRCSVKESMWESDLKL